MKDSLMNFTNDSKDSGFPASALRSSIGDSKVDLKNPIEDPKVSDGPKNEGRKSTINQNESSKTDDFKKEPLSLNYTHEDLNKVLSNIYEGTKANRIYLDMVSNNLTDLKTQLKALSDKQGEPGDFFGQLVIFFNTYQSLFISLSCMAVFWSTCVSIYIQLKTNGLF